MAETATRFTSREAMRLSGASYRQIDYWCATGLFGETQKAHGSGYPRSFDIGDIDALAALRAVSDAFWGTGLHDARRAVAAHVRAHGLHGTVEIAPGILVDLERLGAT